MDKDTAKDAMTISEVPIEVPKTGESYGETKGYDSIRDKTRGYKNGTTG